MTQPNLLLITADQWRGDCLGCARSRHPVMTPHLNQLAAEGVRFTQAVADCPICMPQRVTMLSGQVASRFGLTDNFGVRSPLDARTSLPGRLTREAGYQTKAIGKMHFQPARARFGFEHIVLHPNDYVNWLEEQGYGGMYRGHGLGGNEVYPAVSAVPERYSHTHWIVDQAIQFLGQRDPETPFFLWIVFEAPHAPFDPPEPFDRMYDRITVPDPVHGEWLMQHAPSYCLTHPMAHKTDVLSAEMLREIRRRYYGQISHIDYQLGRLFGELQMRGVYDQTAVVFTSDHGEHLGDHGLFGKSTFLLGSCDVPLILRLPQTSPTPHATIETAAPVLTADICPTLLTLAGLSPGNEMDGVSLLQTLDHPDQAAERIVCGECDRTAFAMDRRWKYVYFAEGGTELLFDDVADPLNLKDLSDSAEHRSQKEGLQRHLVEYLVHYRSPLVENGKLTVCTPQSDEQYWRRQTPAACRGPLRYGQGY